jgi:ribonuclease HI
MTQINAQKITATSKYLNAYTDASVSENGLETGVVILMTNARGAKKIHSLHLLNFGTRNRGNAVLELETKIAALHLAPLGSLDSVISDSSSSLDMINAFRRRQEGEKTSIERHLKEKQMRLFENGLNKHPDVQFVHQLRETRRMRMTDSFSRSARYLPLGAHRFIPSQALKLEMQKEQLRKMLIERCPE